MRIASAIARLIELNRLQRPSRNGTQRPGGDAASDPWPLFALYSNICTFILATLLLSSSLAQGGLYGPEAPRDVAYLRILNATAATEPLTAQVDGEEWQPLAPGEVSDYGQLSPGEHEVVFAGNPLTITAQPESFTTIVVLPEGVEVFQDEPLRDISRGLLSLYNLSDSSVSLHAADGTAVIEGVEPGATGSRPISEAEAQLAVHSGDQPLATLETRLYRRGEAHSIFVLPDGSDPQVIYTGTGAQP